MISASTLLLFLLTVLALLVSPGPNMGFLISHGASHGFRGGVAVALGIFIADIVMTVLTATGMTAMINAWSYSFEIVRNLGAIYLIWLAFQAVRHSGSVNLKKPLNNSLMRITRMALLNSLLNPKALLFFMVFLPQFVTPANGNIPIQLAILGFILSLTALVFHTFLALISDKLITLFSRHKTNHSFFSWLHASLFLGLAVRLLLLDKVDIK